MTDFVKQNFDKIFTFTTRPRKEMGWLGREIHTASVTVDVVWHCKKCKEYFTMEEVKEHKHEK